MDYMSEKRYIGSKEHPVVKMKSISPIRADFNNFVISPGYICFLFCCVLETLKEFPVIISLFFYCVHIKFAH